MNSSCQSLSKLAKALSSFFRDKKSWKKKVKCSEMWKKSDFEKNIKWSFSCIPNLLFLRPFYSLFIRHQWNRNKTLSERPWLLCREKLWFWWPSKRNSLKLFLSFSWWRFFRSFFAYICPRNYTFIIKNSELILRNDRLKVLF